MRKRISILLIAALIFSLSNVVSASASSAKIAVDTTSSGMELDGNYVSIQGYNIQYSNYFKLRDVAAAFANTPSEFNVKWNSKANAIEIVSGETYQDSEDSSNASINWWEQQYATATSANIIVDGKSHPMKAYTINQSTYFQLRDLAAITGFQVNYDKVSDVIELTSKPPQQAYRVKANDVLRTNTVTGSYSRWSDPIHHYMYTNEDGTITTVDAGEKLYIQTYNASYKLISSTKLDYELPLFGAFYSGDTYNYIVFGQENDGQSDSKEVIRVVKYDKNFKRVSSAAVTNAYTVAPFHAGSARIAEQDNMLVLHTARLRYLTEDGLNHQSQLTVLIDTGSMNVMNDLGRFQSNHVSHSFDQYVLFDGSEHVLLDHGDAYPRSIVLSRGDGFEYVERDVVEIPGMIGANMTGVSIGGFDQSSSSYLVAYNTIDHSKAYNYTSFSISGADDRERDIKVAAVPRHDVENGEITYTDIATYIGSDKTSSIPKLVKITDDKFMMLWQESDRDSYSDLSSSVVKYVTLDHEGNKTSDIKELKYFKLGNMQPVVYNDQIVWFVNQGQQKTFYTIPIK